MNSFRIALKAKIKQSQHNHFGIQNYDEYRFGSYKNEQASALKKLVQIGKRNAKRVVGYENKIDVDTIPWLKDYFDGMERLYKVLNQQGKSLIVELIAYQILGYKKVKLARNNKAYQDAVKLGKSLADPNDTYDPHFMHFILQKFNLKPIGYDVQLYFGSLGVTIDFIIEQYAYKLDGKPVVQVEAGDFVIDAGACWGDTALYFAHKAGPSGKVFSFEFIPDNIKLFHHNRSLNPNLENQIELVPHPVSDHSDDTIYYKDNGPGSKIETFAFDGHTGSTTTLTIDDFVKRNNIAKVDFVKMDIEGVESAALRGAVETIKKFRPKLAIAIYHSMEDFTAIPAWILDLDLDYEIFLDHFTIHAEETICFAKPRN
ncbi:FkbM family methyltransferase [Flavobacterium sp.]|uniref:FkbM family methyltransferase n=1 Tax=Flavobacterium sp. TaxID=239 RepID=UPI0026064565|nr:FkbM family methyltransferase [Flavobacterium sp.]